MLSKKYTAEELKKLSVEELQRISNDLNLEVVIIKNFKQVDHPNDNPSLYLLKNHNQLS